MRLSRLSISRSKPRSKSSGRWLQRQASDFYTQQAKKTGYRARSAYKLLEIQEKDAILRQGMTVVDLGAAPGGWSQVLTQYIGRTGKIVALDILPIEPIQGVDIVYGDFEKAETLDALMKTLEGKPVDLVISDLAPNLSGVAGVDQAKSIRLAEGALDFTEKVLVKGGVFLIKLFQGAGFEEYAAFLKKRFHKVVVRKPKASRAESREVYLLAKGYDPYFNKDERGLP